MSWTSISASKLNTLQLGALAVPQSELRLPDDFVTRTDCGAPSPDPLLADGHHRFDS